MSGMTPNNLSRLESPDYGRQTISSLKRIANALDVALVVRFVPFSQYIDWLSGTPRIDEGISPNSLAVRSFEKEEEENLLEVSQFQKQLAQMAPGVVLNVQTVGVFGAITTSATWTSVMYQQDHQTPHIYSGVTPIDKQLEADLSLQQNLFPASLNQSNLEGNYVNA